MPIDPELKKRLKTGVQQFNKLKAGNNKKESIKNAKCYKCIRYIPNKHQECKV